MPDPFDSSSFPGGPRNKEACRTFYNSLNRDLDTTIFGAFSHFLNYGYVSNGNPDKSPFQLKNRELNRASIQLVLEVIGDHDLNGRCLLDVSCGRGGAVNVVARFFNPRRLVGLDISEEAIAFDHRTYRGKEMIFCVGDAETLPFSNASFDALMNIEASHAYQNLAAFYSDAVRVLRPGGLFLYSDVLAPNVFERGTAYLSGLGMTMMANRDITENVLLSCDSIAVQRRAAFGSRASGPDIERFLGLPGSEIYDGMSTKQLQYRILTFVKSC